MKNNKKNNTDEEKMICKIAKKKVEEIKRIVELGGQELLEKVTSLKYKALFENEPELDNTTGYVMIALIVITATCVVALVVMLL